MNIEKKKPGDLAVDGLGPGVIAGSLMIAYLVLGGWMVGLPVAETAAYFSPLEDSAVLGLVTHLAVSAVYGLIFSVLSGRLAGPRIIWVAGMIFGLLLYAVGKTLVIPGIAGALAAITDSQLLVAHLVYGLTLGGQIARRMG